MDLVHPSEKSIGLQLPLGLPFKVTLDAGVQGKYLGSAKEIKERYFGYIVIHQLRFSTVENFVQQTAYGS